MPTKYRPKENKTLLNCANCGHKQNLTGLVNSVKKGIEKMKRRRFTLYSDVARMEKVVGVMKQKELFKAAGMIQGLETDVRDFLPSDAYYTLYEGDCPKCHKSLTMIDA